LIRKLQNNDFLQFQKWAQAIERSSFFNWTLSSLEDSFKKDICWGLWDENMILQSVVCFLNPSEPLELLWLATHPQAENLGLMGRLLKSALDDASRQASLPGGQVILEVHEMNLKAIKLYLALGFTEFGRRKNYYKDGSQAVLMVFNFP
jgi:ribosomal protein S18 acetylase RimI-like enzyme